MPDDAELLKRYAEEGSESAFRELVRRQAGLVYSAALRQVSGDEALAKDVSQRVFFDLARKARSLARRPVLASWLYTSTRFAALNAVRAKRRREFREQEAYMSENADRESLPGPDWEELRPLLDSALHELPERDREAVLMRYFEGRPFAEMGEKLGIGENSARMRSERALEKLRTRLGRMGITSTASALGSVLVSQAVLAPPPGVAAALAGSALAHASAAGAGAGWAIVKFTAMKKFSSTAVAAVGVLMTGLAFHVVDEKVRFGAFFIYSVCFGVGLLFAILSALLGHLFGGHGEVGHGGMPHVEGGAHGHAEAGSGTDDMPGFAPIGPTTIATFVTAFGGIGMVLTRIGETQALAGPLSALGAALIAGSVGWLFSVLFRHTQSSSEGHVRELIGQEATVITPIPEKGVGEIAYVQGGSRYSAPAREETGAFVAGGATVRIVRIVGSQYYVSPS
jgi:RNA polymerase sigma factor (sigma-70 family)